PLSELSRLESPLMRTMPLPQSSSPSAVRWLSRALAAAILAPSLLGVAPCRGQPKGDIEIDFQEAEIGDPLTCRVRVLAPDGRPRRARGVMYVQGWNLVHETMH